MKPLTHGAVNPVESLLPQTRLARLTPHFPPQLVTRAMNEASALCIGAPQSLDGTLLVSDLTGFSARSALLFQLKRRSDDALLALVTAYFSAVLAVSGRFGGSPVFFDGDAISILFHSSGHADTALAAASAIREEVRRTSVLLPIGTINLEASIGLSSGAFLSGSLGRDHARVYTLLGQAGTEAVEAQTLAAASQIIVTASTLSALTSATRVLPVVEGFYRITHDGSRPAHMALSPPVPTELDATQAERVFTFLAAHFPIAVVRQLLCDDIRSDHRQIAALFVNVDGLRELVARKGPDALADLTEFFDGVWRIVDHSGGFLNKVNAYRVGNKYLVLFGLSALPCSDPGSAALQAAFELQAWAGGRPFPLKQRIGFSMGCASECIVGTELRREFTLIGQPINEAVHLMGLARWGEIAAMGDLCQDNCPDGWAISRQRCQIKGYSQECMVRRFSRERG